MLLEAGRVCCDRLGSKIVKATITERHSYPWALVGCFPEDKKRQHGLCGPRVWGHSKVGLFVCFSAQESFPEKLILKAWS